jgi:threonyl-tRNA synthetase
MSDQDEQLKPMRHSLAHLLAAAVLELYPGAQNTIGPAVENGFYQDFDMPEPISEEDLPKIEQKMREILKTWDAFEGREVAADEARQEFKWNKYKLEMIDELAKNNTPITLYTSGSFVDLCRGGHLDSAKQIDPGAFKLQKVSGAYWRGDENKQQLQRVYGLAFENGKALRKHLDMLEEAKKRDHRKLGQELDLFTFSELVGPGLPLYTPRGTIVREGLIALSEEVRAKLGFQRVWSPHITKKELYETSGHWAKFGNELFLVKSQETSDQLVMKPMNCPHHNEIYASRPRSYRDLPIKYMETTTNYRDEKTGELHGLSRVRSLSQDDSHTYCQQEQVEAVFTSLIDAIKDFYRILDMDLKIRLSFRDESDAYLGPQELWDFGQHLLKEIATKNQLDYYVEEGEAAFYGPKIDFMAHDSIGRKWQVATVQFDFVQPERFKLEYTAEDGSQKQPIMVHCAIMGSFDRFYSVYIEHTAGRFPIWLAPEQLRLISVNQEEATVAFAEKVAAEARERGLRVSVDNDNESVGKKIRNAEVMKVPLVVVVGEKEIAGGSLQPRFRTDLQGLDGKTSWSNSSDFLEALARHAKERN